MDFHERERECVCVCACVCARVHKHVKYYFLCHMCVSQCKPRQLGYTREKKSA